MADRMRHHAGAALAAVALAAVLAACTPTPAPTPSPTGFASEEEAFAAAEATYRAYVDALNQVDLGDPTTFEPVYTRLSDRALADEKKSLSKLHADGWDVTGRTLVSAFFPVSDQPSPSAIACLDVSGIVLVDDTGVVQTDAARPDVYAVEIRFSRAADSLELQISDAVAVEDSRCA